MWRIYGGAIMVIAGIAAFIEAHSHVPVAAEPCEANVVNCIPKGASGLSRTAYDLLRIGAWALVILGALTVILGLVRYWQRPR